MNYLKVYCALIRKAQNREIPNTYTEKHHIFPVSIFGKNNRIVILTAREHYIAHAFLEKIYIKRYGFNHTKSQKMISAFWCMNSQKTKNEYLNSYLYEASKIRYISIRKDKKLTEKQKIELSKILQTRKWWTNGIENKHCPEHPGDGWRLGRTGINVGRKVSTETRNKIRLKKTGRKLTEEHKKKVKDELKTRKWWTDGINDKHCCNCPGDNWVLGRTYMKNKYK